MVSSPLPDPVATARDGNGLVKNFFPFLLSQIVINIIYKSQYLYVKTPSNLTWLSPKLETVIHMGIGLYLYKNRT